MKIRVNYNNDELYCDYSKEKIETEEKYIEVKEDYLGDEIYKVYKYEYLDMIIDEHLDNYDQEPEIEED